MTDATERNGGARAPGPATTTSVVEMAAAVRRGELSAVALVDQYLARIDQDEADIHAFNLVMADQARARAAAGRRDGGQGRGPRALAGVPVALKDLLCTRGMPTTCSSRILEGWVPPYDATVVTRLAAAGAVFVGQDQHGRVRHGLVDRELGIRPDPQPPRS